MTATTNDFQVLRHGTESIAGLIATDSLWTALVSRSVTSIADDDVVEVTDDLSHRLAGLATTARQIERAVAHVLSDEDVRYLPATLAAALGDDADLVASLIADHGVWALAKEAADEIRDLVSGELALVDEGLNAYLGVRETEGMMSDRFLCAMARLSIAAGIATVWVPPHGHAAVAVSYGVTTYRVAGCGKTPPRVRPQEF